MPRFTVIVLFIFLLLCSCGDQGGKENQQAEQEKNTQHLSNLIESVWNRKDLKAIDSFFNSSFTRRVNSVNLASSKNELAANLQVYFTGFPDVRIQSDNMVSQGNQVYMSWTLTGTNTGVYGELQPTGKKVRISGITRFDFDESGKIIHEEVYYNELSLLQQMGHTLNPPILE